MGEGRDGAAVRVEPINEGENVNTSEEGEQRDEDLDIKFLFKSTDLIKTFKLDARVDN